MSRFFKSAASFLKAKPLLTLSVSTATAGAVGYSVANWNHEAHKSVTTKLQEVKPFKYATGKLLFQGFREIEELLGKDNVTASPSELDYHSDSYYNTHRPLPHEKPKLVVYPESTEDVSKIMKICHKYKIPVVPFSGGTSLEGQYNNTREGIVIDFSRLNKIIQLNKDDLDVVVQAGVGWQDLDEYLKPHGLLFGPDPGPGAKIGGMVSTSCSGTQAFRYGTMKENVLNLTVVLSDGTILKTKQRAKKSAAGYNLTGLFIGSEGTLGVITEATLKLNPRPAYESIAVVNFNTVKEATLTVEKLLQTGTQLNAIELLDTEMMKCINESGQTEKKWLEKPTLLFKIGGSTPTVMKENTNMVKSISKDFGCVKFQFATNEQDKQELWSARKLILFSSIDYGRKRLSQNAEVWVTDVAVPISKLSEVISEFRKDLDQYQGRMVSSVLGHVGDGNFHSVLVYEPEDKPLARELTSKVVAKALSLEGTCTGEHGIGMGKRHHLVAELGETAIDLMRHLKLAMDPYGLLNTDKVFKVDPTDTQE